MTHICVRKLANFGSDNGLSPGRRQAIFSTNAGILLIGLLGTNFNESFIESLILSFNKMCLRVPSAKWRPQCVEQTLNLGQGLLLYAHRPFSSVVVELMTCITNCIPQKGGVYSQIHHVSKMGPSDLTH